MKKDLIFRDFKSRDYSKVLELWEKTGLGNKERGDKLETIELSLKMGGRFIIMENVLSENLIGTSWMTFDGRRIHLHHFGIDPDFQGNGYSILLLRESLMFASEKNVQIKLEVHKDNYKAIKLYTKYNFKYLGDYKIFIIRDIKNITDSFEDQK